MVRWLLLAHGLALATGLQVTEPADLAGEYGDSPADFAPANYDVNALGVVATSCPCEWATESSPILNGSLSDRILIVNDDVCNNSCTAMVAACAAQLANASGVLVTNRYDPSVLFFDGKYREAAPEGEFAATNARLNASCQDPIPTAYVTSNTTDLLAAAMLVTDAPRLQPLIGARPTLNGPAHPPAPPCCTDAGHSRPTPSRRRLHPWSPPGAPGTPLAHCRDLVGWDMHRAAHAWDVHGTHRLPLPLAERHGRGVAR